MQKREIPVIGEISLAIFKDRPNRFLVNLKPLNSEKIETAFLHDPGRMKELLTPDVKLLVRKPLSQKNRKTKWDILAVEHENSWVVINSSIPNLVVKTALKNRWIPELLYFTEIKPEISIGRSRLDFLLTRDKEVCFVEVKGVTLVENNRALFPDAPTTRGTRHLQELIELKEKGKRAIILFICMRSNPTIFSPNWLTDPIFSEKLKQAFDKGVEILVYKVIPQIVDNQLKLFFQNRINIDINEGLKI
ncbi:MAG TPA: DNA/RNA nuclease SfsA [candidate division Zixibacteria bacterium]|nr:DNA/RNA nuclease SfsA [candidate division Zixibacteria bacterium]